MKVHVQGGPGIADALQTGSYNMHAVMHDQMCMLQRDERLMLQWFRKFVKYRVQYNSKLAALGLHCVVNHEFCCYKTDKQPVFSMFTVIHCCGTCIELYANDHTALRVVHKL